MGLWRTRWRRRTAIVNETMARTLWPKGDALGKCLYLGEEDLPPRTEFGNANRAHWRHCRDIDHTGTGDPAVDVAVILIMVCVAIRAVMAPALRDSTTEPGVALRHE